MARETSCVATDLNALGAFAGDRYFSPAARKRVLIALTDGERPAAAAQLVLLNRAGIRTAFVHVWRADESIWRPKGAEPHYRPDQSSGRVLAGAAGLVEGAVFNEDENGAVVRRARIELGDGPTRPREQRDLSALMPRGPLPEGVSINCKARVSLAHETSCRVCTGVCTARGCATLVTRMNRLFKPNRLTQAAL